MAMMRYTYDYNGMRYTIDAPAGATAADLQAIVDGGSKRSVAAPEVAERQSSIAERRAAYEKQLSDIEARKAQALRGVEERVGPRTTGFFGTESAYTGTLGPFEQQARQVQEQLAALRGQEEFMARTGRAPKELTTGEKIAETLRAVPRGAIESTAQAAGLLGALGPGGEKVAKAVEGFGGDVAETLGVAQSEAVKEALQFDPMAQQLAQVGGGFGSIVPYLVTGGARAVAGAGSLLARGAGATQVALATGQGATQARQQVEQFEQESGQQVDPTTRQLVQLGGGAIGLTELLPIPGMLARLPEGARKTATARLANIATKAGMGRLAPEAAQAAIRETVQELESMAVGRIGMRALEEAGQEAGSQLAQNVLERLAYNEEKDVTEGVAENAAIGAIVGGGVRGGTEVAQRILPDQAAKQAEAEQALQGMQPLETVEIAVPSLDDPNIISRERVDILSAPDKQGNVVFRRADGKVRLMSVESLDSMRVPEEGAFTPEGDTFSGEMIYGRLKAAAGEKPSKQTSGFTEALNRKLSNNLALGRVQDAANYVSALEKRFSGIRKRQAAKEAATGGIDTIQDPTLRVLFEAKSILNDYRVEFAKQQAQPGVTVGKAAPPPTTTLAQILERNQQARDEERATRRELLQLVATDPDIVDKHSAYAEALADYGLDETTDAEASTLLDVMRMESAFETADIQGRASVERQAAIRRAEIIEDALSDPNIDLPNRIRKVNADLMRAGFEPTSPEEVSRIRGRSFAENVFGPSGEYQRRLDTEAEQRQAVLDSVMADESITDKYRAFIEAADEMDLAPPTAEELDMMREAVAEGPSRAQPARTVEAEPEAVAEEAPPLEPTPAPVPTPVIEEAPAALEEAVAGPKVTKLPPGTARGVEKVERGTQGVIRGRPVEGAAELTPGMQDEQELTKRLNTMRNNNLISDQDIGEVLDLIRVPTSQEALNAMPKSQRERWEQVLSLSRDMEEKAEQRDQTDNKKEKKALDDAIKAIDTQLDEIRGKLAKYAMNDAAIRVGKRKLARKNVEEKYKAGEITKAERDTQLAELRVDKALAPRMAAEGITGAKTEAAKKFLAVAKRTRSTRATLEAISKEGGPLGEVAQRLLAIAPDVRMLVVDPETMRLASRNRGEKLADVPYMEGVWVPSRNAIYLSSEMALDHTPVHEAVHPILDRHIEQGTDEGRAITDIFNMFKDLASPEQKNIYGLRDAHEFASEVWGNEQFRELLRSLIPAPTKADPKPRNVLQRMLDAITRIFRKELKTEADATPVIDYIEQVMQLTEQAAAKPLGAAEKARGLENQLPENPNNPRAGQVGIMARLQQLLKPYAKAQSAIARKLYHKYQDIVDYDKQLAAIYGVDKLPDNMAVSHKAELLESSRARRQVQLDRTFIQPIMKKLAELGLDAQDVGLYLWARSAKARNALVRARNAEFPEGGSGMTDAEAEAILKYYALRGLEPKLKEIAKMHDRLVDYLLNLRVQEGLLTRAQADAARRLQPFYTPLKGYAAEGDMQTMGEESPHNEGEYQRNLGIRRTEYTKSQGRKSMPYNPLLMLFADAKQVIQRASINRVGQQLLDNLISDPEANADVATYYTDSDPKIRVKPSENVEYPDGTPVRDVMHRTRGQYLVVKRNGTPYYIEFADTDAGRALRRAFDNMTPKQLEGFMKLWVRGANTIKSLLTRYNPPYLLRAYIRDTMDAVANAYTAETDKASPAFGKKLGAKVAAYTSPASKTGRLIDAAIFRYVAGLEPDAMLPGKFLREKVFGKESNTEEIAEMMLLLEQMMEDGGSPGHAVVHDLELMTKEATDYLKRAKELKAKDPVRFVKEAPQAVFATLNAASEMIDLKARLATYVAALEADIDREGAARLALNSSLNLTRRGEWARALDSTFFFWSPSVESARRFKNMALNSSNGRKIIASQMAMGGMLTLWNMMMGAGDDDDDGRPNWMDLPDATKQTSLVIMTGPGSDDYIALPLGFMLGFPTYAGQKLTEAAYGLISPEAASISIADSLTAIPKAAVTTFSPVKPQGEDAQQFISSFLPNIVKPFGDIAVNRNYFGTPIYTEQFDSDRAASSLGREDTGKVWKWLARSLNDITGGYGTVPGGMDLAPEAYRYFFEAHAGGLYRFGEDTYKFITEDNKDDKTLAQRIPIARSYVGKGSEYVPMTQYYDNTKNVGALVRQQKHEPEEFEKATNKFPVQADQRIMDAYQEAEKARDALGRRRRNELVGMEDPAARKATIDFYRDQEREVFKEFNRIYNAVKSEY